MFFVSASGLRSPPTNRFKGFQKKFNRHSVNMPLNESSIEKALMEEFLTDDTRTCVPHQLSTISCQIQGYLSDEIINDICE